MVPPPGATRLGVDRRGLRPPGRCSPRRRRRTTSPALRSVAEDWPCRAGGARRPAARLVAARCDACRVQPSDPVDAQLRARVNRGHPADRILLATVDALAASSRGDNGSARRAVSTGLAWPPWDRRRSARSRHVPRRRARRSPGGDRSPPRHHRSSAPRAAVEDRSDPRDVVANAGGSSSGGSGARPSARRATQRSGTLTDPASTDESSTPRRRAPALGSSSWCGVGQGPRGAIPARRSMCNVNSPVSPMLE